MRLATIRTSTGTAAVRVDEDGAVELGAAPLAPGDIIATGTPGGVGHARKPPRCLTEGSRLGTRVEGLGEQRNILVAGGTVA